MENRFSMTFTGIPLLFASVTLTLSAHSLLNASTQKTNVTAKIATK